MHCKRSRKNMKNTKVEARFMRINAFSHKEFIKRKSAKIRSLCANHELRGLFHAFVISVRN